MEVGALGTETRDVESLLVTGYFDKAPDLEGVRSEIQEALRVYNLPASTVKEISTREMVDQDWLLEWKKSWQPVAVANVS